MKKINFKQPKYIFPLVILLPLVCLVYFAVQTFGGGADEPQVATDRINLELPEANPDQLGNKLDEMSRRYGEDDAFTAVGILGEEIEEKEELSHGYTDAQLDSIDAANAEQERQRQEIEALQRSLAESRRHINNYSYADYESDDNYSSELEDIRNRTAARQREIDKALGIADEETAQPKETTQPKEEPAKPELVVKSEGSNANMFNTVSSSADNFDSPLIRAMIDQTTKAREGTRLRFKLLDDVTVSGVTLCKGTYLYGTVTGFGQQRVKANITSILVGSRFIKVDLAVFDNDGMEGFYVPESAFRDFMKDAGASAMQSNINMNGGYGSELSGEALALQALQNIYSSASNAISSNIRKNKAKIKYNTIVYLINTNQAQ